MVRGEMGLKNVEIMIPFVRTLDMAKDVNEVLVPWTGGGWYPMMDWITCCAGLPFCILAVRVSGSRPNVNCNGIGLSFSITLLVVTSHWKIQDIVYIDDLLKHSWIIYLIYFISSIKSMISIKIIYWSWIFLARTPPRLSNGSPFFFRWPQEKNGLKRGEDGLKVGLLIQNSGWWWLEHEPTIDMVY